MKILFAAVCKKDKIRTLKSLCGGIAFLLLIGCAPQPSFHFFPSSGSLAHQGHAQAESSLHKTDAPKTSLPTKDMIAEDMTAEDVSIAATASEKDTTFGTPIHILPHAERVNVETRHRHIEKPLDVEQVSLTPFDKAAKKKSLSKASGERPVQNSSWLSFGLTIAGLVLFLITLVASAPLIPFALSWISFLIAVITSRNAISKIKRNPEQFSGKELAQVSFFISVLMNIVMFILFVIFLIQFASALAGLGFSIILI